MKKLVLAVILLFSLALPVHAEQIDVPDAPDEAEIYMPDEPQNFGEGLLYVLTKAIAAVSPELKASSGVCISLIGIMLLCSMFRNFSSPSQKIVDLASALMVGLLLLSPANTLIRLGISTITDLNEYGKLFMPAMATALAAQGGTVTSAALYTATIAFTVVLSMIVQKIIVPVIYTHICLSLACCAMEDEILSKLKAFSKWLATWILKIMLYVFMGYVSITGVISGTADATAVKAVKLSISAFVPVIGGILSDASETILVGAAAVKNAAGLYGLFAMLCIWIGPFIKIGLQYVLLKATGAICTTFGNKKTTDLIKDFSTSMGLVLAMTGTLCLLLIISTVCFMRSAI